MDSTYKITISGTQPNSDSQAIKNKLSTLLKGNPKEIDKFIHRVLTGNEAVFAKGISQERAQNILQKFTDIGLICYIAPMQLSLVPIEEEIEKTSTSTYTCPACGHTSGSDTCERCGVVGQHYNSYTELKKAIELERRRIEAESAYEDEKESAQEERQRQKKLRALARSYIKKRMGTTYWSTVKAFFKSRGLAPALTSVAAAVTGIGLLVWQLGINRPAPVEAEPQPRTPLTITPSPNTLKAATAIPATGNTSTTTATESNANGTVSVTQSNPTATTVDKTATPTLAKNSGATTQLPPVSTTSSGVTAKTSTSDPARLSTPPDASTHLATSPDASTKPTATSTINGKATNTTNSATRLIDSIAQPSNTPVNIVPPTNTSDPYLLINLSRYRARTGALNIAKRNLDQATESLSTHSSHFSPEQLDAFNRTRVEIMAEIANQQYKRQEISAAQTLWLQSIKLTDMITSPKERVLAFSSIARYLHDSNTSAASDYFKRAEENARTIVDPIHRAMALGALARDLAATGRTDKSRELFAQATTTTTNQANAPNRQIALSAIAQYRAEAGESTFAQALLKEINSANIASPPLVLVQHRLQTQSAIAYNLALSGDIPTARTEFMAVQTSAVALSDPDTRDGVLLYLAQTLAHAGDLESANQIATEVLKKRGISSATKAD